ALPGDRALLPPSPARCESIGANLISASGYQDHTALPSATGAFVLCADRVHRIPHPTFVTIRETPLFSRRDSVNHEADLGLAPIARGCGRLARRAIFAWQASAITVHPPL